jgi:nucleoside-diphosphate-sugar epimerase
MKRVLLLGASGLVGPYIIAGLEQHYELRLADIKANPHGRPVQHVDIADYGQVREAAQGMDAILNFTVNRYDPVHSFAVSVRGAYNVFRAAVELGITKVVHTGPELVAPTYRHEFGIEDAPLRAGTHYYGYTKYMSMELCKAFARLHGLQVICFLFAGLGARPEEPQPGREMPPFTIVWEDLVEACRLAVELESVPDNYQYMNLHSHIGHGKYLLNKAERILGYRPGTQTEALYRRLT